MYEIIAAGSNFAALAVIGVIYAAYIKNLRAVNELKDSQLRIAEQNVKLWKDRVLELERRTPEFVEKQLSERIKIREDELSRLLEDSAAHRELAEQKNQEINLLRESIEKAAEYRKSITVWDKDEREFVEVSHGDLEQRYIGCVYVDSASLAVGDPTYHTIPCEIEKEDFPVLNRMYRVLSGGELFCCDQLDNTFPSELLGFDKELTIQELLDNGLIEEVQYDRTLPAISSSYIKGDLRDSNYRTVRHLSFLNGCLGAGIIVSVGSDGVYPVYIEYYKERMQRLIIEL